MQPYFNLSEYLESQIKEIDKIKWIESEKNGSDIGFDKAKEIWINKYAEEYKYFWLKNHPIKKK